MTNANAPTPSSAVPAVGAADKRILGRDTDAYSEAQFAKPGVPKTHWNADDQAKRSTGELPTRCGCTKLTVMEHNGIRCYILSITHDTLRVELFKDADAIVLIRKVVPALDDLQPRDTVEFDPPCQISFRPIHEGMITRKKLLTFELPPRAPKSVEPSEENKPVNTDMTKTLDETFERKQAPADKAPATDWPNDKDENGKFWGTVNGKGFYKYAATREWTEEAKRIFIHVVLEVKSLKDVTLARQAAEQRVLVALVKFENDLEYNKTINEKMSADYSGEAQPETRAVDAASAPVPVPPTPNGATAAHAEPQSVPSTEQPKTAPALAISDVLDTKTGEIIVFDPNRALERTKQTSALVNRLVMDKVLVEGIDYGPIPGSNKPTLFKPGAEKLLSAFQLFDKFEAVEVVRDWKNGFFFYEYECTLYDRETGKAIGSGIGNCNSQEKKYRYRWVTKDRVAKGVDLASLPQKGGKISEFDFAVDKAETSGQYGKPADYWRQFQSAIDNGSAQKVTRKTSKGKEMQAWEIDSTMYGIQNDEIFDIVNTLSKMAQKRALVAAALNATGASAVFTQDLEDFTDFGMIA